MAAVPSVNAIVDFTRTGRFGGGLWTILCKVQVAAAVAGPSAAVVGKERKQGTATPSGKYGTRGSSWTLAVVSSGKKGAGVWYRALTAVPSG